MVLSLIVTGVAFSIYRLNASYYLREDAYLQQHQNLRVALFTVGRDARMAGNGFSLLGADVKLVQAYTPTRESYASGTTPPTNIIVDSAWYRNPDTTVPGVRAIFGVDGGANLPDTLTIFRAEVESGNPLATVNKVSGDTLELGDVIPEEAIKSGDIIAVGSGAQGLILQTGNISFTGGGTTQLPIKTGGRFTAPSGFVPTGFTIQGAYIYNFRDIGIITYYVDSVNNNLMAAYHDVGRNSYDDAAGTSSVVANNIEDFQVYYYLDNKDVDFTDTTTNPDISTAILNARRVKAVSIGLTARSPYGAGPSNRSRPALFNRAAGTSLDSHPRNILVETIYLRNFSI
jgi:hypothetical protein